MLHLTFGDRIKLENDSQLWDFRDSKIENTLSHLLAKLQVQKKALEFLEIPKNFYDYYFSKRENNIYIYEAVICSGYWIDIPQINTQLENCLTYINNELDQNIAWIKKIYDDLTLLRSKSNSNQVLEMLRTWRENSLFKLNLFDHLN